MEVTAETKANDPMDAVKRGGSKEGRGGVV